MVLTRSSYSRLGTPLASPLPNRERKLPSPSDSTASPKLPGPARTRSRSRVTALRRQSTGTDTGLSLSPGPSTATSPTRSAPLSLRSPPSPSRSLDGPHSLPPDTPLMFQFGFELMHRLDNTLMHRSPACTDAELPAPDSNVPPSQGAPQRPVAAQQETANDAPSATGPSPARSCRSRPTVAASPSVAAVPAQQPQPDAPPSASPSHPIEPQLRPATLNLLHSNCPMTTHSAALDDLPAQPPPPSSDLPACPEPQSAAERSGSDPPGENIPDNRLPASSSASDATVSAERADTADCPPIASDSCANEPRVSGSQALAGEPHTQPCLQSQAQGVPEEAACEGESRGDVDMADASQEAEQLLAEGLFDNALKEKNGGHVVLPKVDSQVVAEIDTEKEERSTGQGEGNEAGVAISNKQSEKDKSDTKELSTEKGKAGEVEVTDEAEKEHEDEEEMLEMTKAGEVEVLSEHVGAKEVQEVELVQKPNSQRVEGVAEGQREKEEKEDELEEKKAEKLEALSEREGEEGESAEYRTAEEVVVASEDECEDHEEVLAEKSKAQDKPELEDESDEQECEDELANTSKTQEAERELEDESDEEEDVNELPKTSQAAEAEHECELDDPSEKAAEKDELAVKALTADDEVMSGDKSAKDQEVQLVEKVKAEGIEVAREASESTDEESDSSEADEEPAGRRQELVEIVSESSSSEEAASDAESDKGSSSSSDEDDEELDGLLAKARARLRDPNLLADVIPLQPASPATQVKGNANVGASKGMLSRPLVGSQIGAASVGVKRKSEIVIQDRFGGESAPRSKTRKMDWHELPRQEVTPEVKREIQAMRLHRTLDPKSFVKGGLEKSLKEPIPERFLFGHVISAVEPSSSSSKPKKRSFVESLVGDENSKSWTKKKYVEEVQASGSSGGKGFWKALKKKRQK